MSAELIYKTTSPAAIEWWLDAERKVKADRELQLAYELRLTEEFGAPAHPDYIEEHRRKRRGLWFRNDRPYAVDSLRNENPPADSGWRLDSKERLWRPKLATAAGKKRAAELAALCTFVLRDHMHEIGIPAIAFSGDGYMHRPGVEFDADEQALYVLWGSSRCADEALANQAKNPHIEWVEIPRSVWYARIEAKEKK